MVIVGLSHRGTVKPNVEARRLCVDLGCRSANTPTVNAPVILLTLPNTVLRLGGGDR